MWIIRRTDHYHVCRIKFSAKPQLRRDYLCMASFILIPEAGCIKQPTVNLDADLMGTCGCLFTKCCHWPRRIFTLSKPTLRLRPVETFRSQAAINSSFLFFFSSPLPFPLLHSEQAYNWSPLISGAGASWIKCLEISIAHTLPPSGSASSVWQTVGAEFRFEEKKKKMESPVQKLIKRPNKWHSFIKHAYQYAHTHSPTFTQRHSRDLIIATNENREAFLYYYLAFIFPLKFKKNLIKGFEKKNRRGSRWTR